MSSLTPEQSLQNICAALANIAAGNWQAAEVIVDSVRTIRSALAERQSLLDAATKSTAGNHKPQS